VYDFPGSFPLGKRVSSAESVPMGNGGNKQLMNRNWQVLLYVTLVSGTVFFGSSAAGEPVRVIFDTDMDTDCDDAGALAMLHALADQGKVKILATMVSSKYQYSAPCVCALNTYFGRPNLPLGVPKGEGASTKRGSKYAHQIAHEFPGSMKNNDDAPDARSVYRRVLASQPDGSVVIVSVGYLTNLRDLLKTQPDEESKLDGHELVRQKVKYWVCMGGAYPRRLKHGGYGNFMPHAEATVAAVRDWPGDIFFSGDGKHIHSGRLLRSHTATVNPVKCIYELYLGSRPTRPSWDQVALLYAVEPKASYWQVTSQGHNHIFSNATNEWRPDPDNVRHHLVQIKPDMREDVTKRIETLIAYMPPKKQRNTKDELDQ
jgi:hypothetical protein